MSGIVLIFTRSGIVAVEGGSAGQAAITYFSEKVAAGDAYVLGVDVVNGTAQTYEQYLNVETAKEIYNDAITNQDVNALTRDAFAATLGLMTGVLTAPLGPVPSVALGEGMSEAFKNAYNRFQDWASQQDMSFLDPVWAMFDRLKRIIDDGTNLTYQDVQNHQLTINHPWNSANRWRPPRDPLALDLDGDGIETVGADGAILFDHDGDGIRTGTGWVKGDDAFLVLDRNANGTIDSGAELFGVDTVLANGAKAANGFAALKDLDSNGDNLFTAADARFAQVRLWRDLDEDGISDAGELIALTEAGITRINLNATVTSTNLAGGNRQTATATYTRANGTTGTAGDVSLDGNAANLDLASNPFYREFTDSLPITGQAAGLAARSIGS